MKILIVDDETISRKILLKKMELIGTCTSVDDSYKAIKLFDKATREKKPYTLMTLDISMPKMDGKQLLEMIRKKEKASEIPKNDRVKIIMVTSRMTISTIKECIRLGCNGYILKPVNKYQLLDSLGRMGVIQMDNLERDKKPTHSQIVAKVIKRFYNGKITLPIFPKIVQDVQKLMKEKDPSIDDFARIIKKDILISSKLVSIANSPFYKGVDKIENLKSALLRLGMKTSYGLITTLVTKDLYNSTNKTLNKLLKNLWMHSFTCGCIAKRISEELGVKNADTLFLMGIVHDIGKMLLIKAIVDIIPKESFESEDIQIAIHEIHTTFGAAILKKMRFSKDFIQIAEFHHWNDFSKNEEQELRIIHLSDNLANQIGFRFFHLESQKDLTEEEMIKKLKNLESLKQLKLDSDKVMGIANKIKTQIQETEKAF